MRWQRDTMTRPVCSLDTGAHVAEVLWCTVFVQKTRARVGADRHCDVAEQAPTSATQRKRIPPGRTCMRMCLIMMRRW